MTAHIKGLTQTQEKLSLEMKQRGLVQDKDSVQLRNIEEKLNLITTEKKEIEILLTKYDIYIYIYIYIESMQPSLQLRCKE